MFIKALYKSTSFTFFSSRSVAQRSCSATYCVSADRIDTCMHRPTRQWQWTSVGIKQRGGGSRGLRPSNSFQTWDINVHWWTQKVGQTHNVSVQNCSFSQFCMLVIFSLQFIFGAPNFCSTVPSPRSVMALNHVDLYKIVVTRSSTSDNMMSDLRRQLRIAWSIIATAHYRSDSLM